MHAAPGSFVQTEVVCELDGGQVLRRVSRAGCTSVDDAKQTVSSLSIPKPNTLRLFAIITCCGRRHRARCWAPCVKQGLLLRTAQTVATRRRSCTYTARVMPLSHSALARDPAAHPCTTTASRAARGEDIRTVRNVLHDAAAEPKSTAKPNALREGKAV